MAPLVFLTSASLCDQRAADHTPSAKVVLSLSQLSHGPFWQFFLPIVSPHENASSELCSFIFSLDSLSSWAFPQPPPLTESLTLHQTSAMALTTVTPPLTGLLALCWTSTSNSIKSLPLLASTVLLWLALTNTIPVWHFSTYVSVFSSAAVMDITDPSWNTAQLG